MANDATRVKDPTGDSKPMTRPPVPTQSYEKASKSQPAFSKGRGEIKKPGDVKS